MTSEKQILNGILRFEPRIVVDAVGIGPDTLKNVVAMNPKVAYYLNSVSASVVYDCGPKAVLTVGYANKDVPLNDIYTVSTVDEIRSLLCQYAGNYKKKLVIFVKPGVDVQTAYDKFVTSNAPFYPSLVDIRTYVGSSSMHTSSFYTFEFSYRIGKVKLAMMENEMDAEIARIAKLLFLPRMPLESRVLLAHNYLAHTIKYNLIEKATALEKSYMHSAYGALVHKKCVCQGYAEAFKRLLDYTGVSCDIVCGTVKGYPDYHAWNIVRLNHSTDNYHIDVTWDSTDMGVSYKYFGLSDSDFIYDRVWSREFNAKCNSKNNLYLAARRGLEPYKTALIAKGVDPAILR